MSDHGGSPSSGGAFVFLLLFAAMWALTRVRRVDDWIDRWIDRPLASALAWLNGLGSRRRARRDSARQRASDEAAGRSRVQESTAQPTTSRRAWPRAVGVFAMAYLALFAWFCLYVPWEQRVRGVRRPLGYSALWDPPTEVYGSAVIDVNRVVLVLVAISALFAAALVLAWCARNRGE